MNRPPMRSSFESPVGRGVPPNARTSPTRHTMAPDPHEPLSPNRSIPYHDGARGGYEHIPPMHDLPHRASHVHMPGVSTYIGHYHYYNFNGNCTVQQASGDGQPNTIQMVQSSIGDPGPAHPQQVHRVDVPPIPPPMRDHIGTPRGASHTYAVYAGAERHGQEDRKRHSMPFPSSSHFSALGDRSGHLAHIPGSSKTLGIPGTGLSRHQGSFLTTSRYGKPHSVASDPPGMRSQSPLFPPIRSAVEGSPPIALAPLQGPPPGLGTISSMQSEQRKISSGRPTKRTRLSRNMSIPMATQDIGRGQVGSAPGIGAMSAVGIVRAAGPSGGSDSNGESASDDKERGIHRGNVKGYDLDRIAPNATSSSPSQGDNPGGTGSGRGDGFERSSSAPALRGRGGEESTSNDWEAVVEMYTTGKGTEDGVALKNITKGDGRRVSDRKLLEKRRTIGKTYECLGAERFEAAIGYKWENGARRKQKMYHVISRCRVVNAMRKAGENIPTDFLQLTELIDERIAEKEAAKEGRAGTGTRRIAGGNERGGGVNMTLGSNAMGNSNRRYSAAVGMEGLRGVTSGSGVGLGRGSNSVSGADERENMYR